MITLSKSGKPTYAPSPNNAPLKKGQKRPMNEWGPEKLGRWWKRPVAIEGREVRRGFRRPVGEGYVGKRG